MNAEQVEWLDSEWADGGFAAYVDGVEANVSPSESGDGWFWSVKATSAVSEWPEVWNCGVEQWPSVAKRKAASSLMKARKAYRVRWQEYLAAKAAGER